MATFFNEFFGLDRQTVEDYGAFNVSIVNDLPLFIDPFLIFHSEKEEYQALHASIIRYMKFLRDAVVADRVTDDLLKAWFMFPEIRQNWLGFCLKGNQGHGLGRDFATALRTNLKALFGDFGAERVTRGSHIEKVCLVREGIGRDNISDFTTNLILNFLCDYTQRFAKDHLDTSRVETFWIPKARFDYQTESWRREQYELPKVGADFVLLTPKDMLTRDENWINRGDLVREFASLPPSIDDAALRAQVMNYFERALDPTRDRYPTQREQAAAAIATLKEFPQLVDYYIRSKEQRGDDARDMSSEKVADTSFVFESQLKDLQALLAHHSGFYTTAPSTYEEAHRRIAFLKDVIENKGGHRIFYHKGRAIQREEDIQILFRLTWIGSPSDPGREANDGRGPVDFKISRGSSDKTLVEMKLAKNSHLERNLQKQLPIYQAASDAKKAISAIAFFSEAELARVEGILARLRLTGHRDIVLIDAREDNKPSGSKA